jgi:cytosine deaminase
VARRITNARLADGRRVDIGVGEDGRISTIEPVGGREPLDEDLVDVADEVDVGGWLVLPAMVEPHAHIDKALTAELVPNPTGDLTGAITAWNTAAEQGVFTHDDMVARIRRALDLLLLNGVTAVRSHINCGARSGVTHLRAASEAIEPFAGLMDVQLVALVHSPTVGPGSEENRRALDAALETGAGLVGGAPHLEPDGDGAMAHALLVATRSDCAVDLHTDETLDPAKLDLRQLARMVVDAGMEGRITASHCVSLGMQPPAVQAEVAHEVTDAGISVVTLPQTNLFLQGRDEPRATPRGLTAIHALVEAGALVAAGGDNVQDPFNLVGRSDPLETAALLVAAGHVLPDDAYEMVSNAGRRTLGLDPVRMEVGDPADLVAIDAPSIRGAIADAPLDRTVFRAGRVVATSTSSRTVHR